MSSSSSSSVVLPVLPDELWIRILESGISSGSLRYKDLICISISCKHLINSSSSNFLWSMLLSRDFPKYQHLPSSSSTSPKSVYQFRFAKDRARIVAANRRALFRMESQVCDHLRKVTQLGLQFDKELLNLKTTISDLSHLRTVRHASVALNVWQPEIIRTRQRQLVEQCAVPVDARICSLQMELKLCRNQIASLDKAYENEKRRLDKAREQLASMKYHPLRDYHLGTSRVDESSTQKKKVKRSIDYYNEKLVKSS